MAHTGRSVGHGHGRLAAVTAPSIGRLGAAALAAVIATLTLVSPSLAVEAVTDTTDVASVEEVLTPAEAPDGSAAAPDDPVEDLVEAVDEAADETRAALPEETDELLDPVLGPRDDEEPEDEAVSIPAPVAVPGATAPPQRAASEAPIDPADRPSHGRSAGPASAFRSAATSTTPDHDVLDAIVAEAEPLVADATEVLAAPDMGAAIPSGLPSSRQVALEVLLASALLVAATAGLTAEVATSRSR